MTSWRSTLTLRKCTFQSRGYRGSMTKVRKKVLRLNNDLENVLNQEVKWKKIFYIRHNLLLTKS